MIEHEIIDAFLQGRSASGECFIACAHSVYPPPRLWPSLEHYRTSWPLQHAEDPGDRERLPAG
jgi:hypothetical protein